jgi:heme exporter protein D
MITFILVAFTLLVVLAIVVGIVDARQAPAWREIAAERRREAEERARKRVH